MKSFPLLQPVVFAALFAAAGPTSLPLGPQQANQPPQYIEKSYPVPPGNELPDRNAQMQMHQKQNAKKNFEVANLERKRQIDNDTQELVRLARDLKAAVDKSDRDTSELIRKADLIEKLAHAVKEKMKLVVTAS